jgi:hypothetical protein
MFDIFVDLLIFIHFHYMKMHRVRATGTTSDRRRSGRPRETTLRQNIHITLNHLRNRFVTTVDTARRIPGIRNKRISDQIVRNRLRQSEKCDHILWK